MILAIFNGIGAWLCGYFAMIHFHRRDDLLSFWFWTLFLLNAFAFIYQLK